MSSSTILLVEDTPSLARLYEQYLDGEDAAPELRGHAVVGRDGGLVRGQLTGRGQRPG